jgi:hypothetical protein
MHKFKGNTTIETLWINLRGNRETSMKRWLTPEGRDALRGFLGDLEIQKSVGKYEYWSARRARALLDARDWVTEHPPEPVCDEHAPEPVCDDDLTAKLDAKVIAWELDERMRKDVCRIIQTKPADPHAWSELLEPADPHAWSELLQPAYMSWFMNRGTEVTSDIADREVVLVLHWLINRPDQPSEEVTRWRDVKKHVMDIWPREYDAVIKIVTNSLEINYENPLGQKDADVVEFLLQERGKLMMKMSPRSIKAMLEHIINYRIKIGCVDKEAAVGELYQAFKAKMKRMAEPDVDTKKWFVECLMLVRPRQSVGTIITSQQIGELCELPKRKMIRRLEVELGITDDGIEDQPDPAGAPRAAEEPEALRGAMHAERKRYGAGEQGEGWPDHTWKQHYTDMTQHESCGMRNEEFAAHAAALRAVTTENSMNESWLRAKGVTIRGLWVVAIHQQDKDALEVLHKAGGMNLSDRVGPAKKVWTKACMMPTPRMLLCLRDHVGEPGKECFSLYLRKALRWRATFGYTLGNEFYNATNFCYIKS